MSGAATTGIEAEDLDLPRVISNVPLFALEKASFEESRESFDELLNSNSIIQASDAFTVYDLEDGYTRDLFDICDRLLVTAEVKIYAAILLNKYDAFKCSHGFIHRLSFRYICAVSDIRDVRLRMISVIQIASKMHMMHFSPRVHELIAVMKDVEGWVSPEQLVESELIVLEVLDFDVMMHSSPVAYLEAILHTLAVKHASDFKLNLEMYWKTVLQLLELVYLSYSQAFELADETYRRRTKECNMYLNRRSFNHLRMDYVLLACGIICVPISRLFGYKKLLQMVHDLSACAGLRTGHVLAMGAGIYDAIMKDSRMHQSTFDLLVKFDEMLLSLKNEASKSRRMARKRRAEEINV
ncbi:hypothetical protein QR680_009773 [Steinernema hermaphroditum]|uniref:Cyclin N-terminal domain-containing protein n=1 Tax=Steinernema hermaphroditum TaxID=289476 RepID=A0AA39ILM2_9BILA|nr:hypothetical protein QR680_009773 [Steinernema hermaphroditum]